MKLNRIKTVFYLKRYFSNVVARLLNKSFSMVNAIPVISSA